MSLADYGYYKYLQKVKTDDNLANLRIGRVLSEHKESYIVMTDDGEMTAEITGNLRFTAVSREDLPAVGDWTALSVCGSDFAVINKVLPRYSVITRQAVGRQGDLQIIAANIDFALLVQSVDRDFNINRLERYLTICYNSKVTPIIVLTKIDLKTKTEISELISGLKNRIVNVDIITVSSEIQSGYDELKRIIISGETFCMLGSSGAGKSTIVNNLSGRNIMKTGQLSSSTGKGCHITTSRELILLNDGGMLIDNPGMREVGIADSSEGMEITFDKIYDFAQNCRFNNCTHTSEIGCAVISALENNLIDPLHYQSYLKMEREKAHFETSVAEKRKKEKEFGKILKEYNKKFSHK